jgi:metal-responsive CopG/Arc/MetJ family transcriptional regulator
MGTTAKVAISLPKETLEELDRECKKRNEPRSALVRQAVDHFLKQEKLARDVQRYIEGYRKKPETQEDKRLSSSILKHNAQAGLYDDETW